MSIDLTATTIALIMAGGLAGGFVNGLTGFGTGLSAMPVWLQVLHPNIAAQLAAGGGVAGQLMTFRAIWHTIDWRALAPFLLAGLAGVPIGAACLPYVDPVAFKRGVGVLLVAFSLVMLLGARFTVAMPRGRATVVAIGFASGLLGGLAGLSGVFPTLWAALEKWTKEQRRAVFQAFNFTILAFTLVNHAAQGLLTRQFWIALALALPGTFAGVFVGQRLYARLSDRGFDRVVLALLGLAGLAMLVTNH